MQGHLQRRPQGEEGEEYADSGHYASRYINPEEFHDPEEDMVMEWEIRRLMESPKGEKGSSEALAWDDLTGMRLDGDKVKEARFKHIQYVRDKNVWSKVPRKQALARGWNLSLIHI